MSPCFTFRSPGAAVPRLAVLALALAAAAVRAAEVTEFNKSGITVVDSTVNPVNWIHGTTLHSFVIENHRPVPRTLTLAFDWSLNGAHGASASDGLSLSRTVTVGPGAKAAITLPQPACRYVYTRWSLRESGVETQYGDSKSTQDAYSSRSSAEPAILLSRSFSAEQFSDAFSNIVATTKRPSTSSYSSSSEGYLRPARQMAEAPAWPADWRAYSAFDACFVTAAEWAAFPEGVRQALKSFVAFGGVLVVADPARKAPEGFDGGPIGRVASGKVAGCPYATCGHGCVCAAPSVNTPAWPEALRRHVYAAACNSRANVDTRKDAWSGVYDFARGEIPVAGGTDVPVGLFFVVLLVFAVLAGPVCVFVLARRNRRIWLFAVVPAFSALVGAVIFVVLLVSEGVTPHERRQALTILDQEARFAVTRGEVGVYAPAALSGGLRFDDATEVMPLPYARNGGGTVEIGDGQRYDGWTPPRMPAFFRLRRAEPRAERLVVTELPDGRVEVVNALGAPIAALSLGDGRGNGFVAEGLAAGERRTLSPLAAPPPGRAGDWSAFQALLVKNGSGIVQPQFALVRKAAAGLGRVERRRYVARLAGCPFLEQPLGPRAVREDAESIVVGSY